MMARCSMAKRVDPWLRHVESHLIHTFLWRRLRKTFSKKAKKEIFLYSQSPHWGDSQMKRELLKTFHGTLVPRHITASWSAKMWKWWGRQSGHRAGSQESREAAVVCKLWSSHSLTMVLSFAWLDYLDLTSRVWHPYTQPDLHNT